MAQVRLSLERVDRPGAGAGKDFDPFEAIAVRQVRQAGIRHRVMPHDEHAQVSEIAEHVEAAIGNAGAAQIQVAEIRQAGERSKTCVRDVLRPAQLQPRHVIETRDPLQERVRHLSVRVDRGQLSLRHRFDRGVPISRVQRTLHHDLAVVLLDLKSWHSPTIRARARPGDALRQLRPALESARARRDVARVVDRDVGFAGFSGIQRQRPTDLIQADRPLEHVLDAFSGASLPVRNASRMSAASASNGPSRASIAFASPAASSTRCFSRAQFSKPVLASDDELRVGQREARIEDRLDGLAAEPRMVRDDARGGGRRAIAMRAVQLVSLDLELCEAWTRRESTGRHTRSFR